MSAGSSSGKLLTVKNVRGQAMLIVVLVLGGAILGATTIAGTLMLYQIRATNDAANSAKAIFAADSGVEWALYSFFNPPAGPLPTFSNGASLTVNCYDASNATVSCDLAGTTVVAISKGTSFNSSRAFSLNFTAATTTYP